MQEKKSNEKHIQELKERESRNHLTNGSELNTSDLIEYLSGGNECCGQQDYHIVD